MITGKENNGFIFTMYKNPWSSAVTHTEGKYKQKHKHKPAHGMINPLLPYYPF